MSLQIIFFADAPSSFFCNWLEEFTWDAPYKSFPTEKGRITIQRARPSGLGNKLYMSMEGMYIVPQDNHTEMGYPMNDVIRFKVIPLTPSRIEIVAECSQPVANEYFLYLLTEISKRWPQPDDVNANLSKIKETIETGLADIKLGQAAIYAKVGELERKSLTQIMEAVHQGRVEQGEIARTLDAIRRAIRFIQTTNMEMGQPMRELADKAEHAVQSDLSLQQKLELTLPILPGFLNYKIELGAQSNLDLETLRAEIYERWVTLVAQVQK